MSNLSTRTSGDLPASSSSSSSATGTGAAVPPPPYIKVEEDNEQPEASTTPNPGAPLSFRQQPTSPSESESKFKSKSRQRPRSRSPQRLAYRFEPHTYDLSSHLSLFDSDKDKQAAKILYTVNIIDGGYNSATHKQSIKIQLNGIGFQRGTLLRGSEPKQDEEGETKADASAESGVSPSVVLASEAQAESKMGFFQSAQMILIHTESQPLSDSDPSHVSLSDASDATDVTYTNGYPLRPAPNLVESSSHSKTKGFQLSFTPAVPTLSTLPVVGSAKYTNDSTTVNSTSLNYALRPYYIEPNFFQILFPPSLLGLLNDNENYWQAPGSDPESASSGVGLDMAYWDRQASPDWITIEASQVLYLKRKKVRRFFQQSFCFSTDAEALMPDTWLYPVSRYIRLRHRLVAKIRVSSLFLVDSEAQEQDVGSESNSAPAPAPAPAPVSSLDKESDERPYLSLAFDLGNAPQRTKWIDTQTLDHGNYIQIASLELLTPLTV